MWCVICDKCGLLFETNYDTNLERMKKDHRRYNPHHNVTFIQKEGEPY